MFRGDVFIGAREEGAVWPGIGGVMEMDGGYIGASD